MKLFWYAGSDHRGLTLHFRVILDYDDLYSAKQNLHHYLLALHMINHSKRNCVLLSLCIYSTVILTQFYGI